MKNPALVDYVVDRLADLGIEHAFGVPRFISTTPSSPVADHLGRLQQRAERRLRGRRRCVDPRSGDPNHTYVAGEASAP